MPPKKKGIKKKEKSDEENRQIVRSLARNCFHGDMGNFLDDLDKRYPLYGVDKALLNLYNYAYLLAYKFYDTAKESGTRSDLLKDIFSAGLLGFLLAVRNFRPYNNYSPEIHDKDKYESEIKYIFRSYSMLYCKGEILKTLNDHLSKGFFSSFRSNVFHAHALCDIIDDIQNFKGFDISKGEDVVYILEPYKEILFSLFSDKNLDDKDFSVWVLECITEFGFYNFLNNIKSSIHKKYGESYNPMYVDLNNPGDDEDNPRPDDPAYYFSDKSRMDFGKIDMFLLWEAMHGLQQYDEDAFSAFTLYYYLGYSKKDTAEKLGKAERTIDNYCSKARKFVIPYLKNKD